MIEEPEKALSALEDLVGNCLDPRAHSICLDQKGCKVIDACAESVAGALAVEAREHHGSRFWGYFPEDPVQQQIVLATGIPRHLGIELEEPEGFKAFNLQRGVRGPQGGSGSSQTELTTTALTRYLDDCLRGYGVQLTREGRAHVLAMVGEVIDNASAHGGRRDWWVLGYLRQQPDHKYGDCHITVFNFGKTITETVQEMSERSAVRDDIEMLISRHSAFFRDPLRRLTKDTLWTLYALQQGVSRYSSDDSTAIRRGQGLAKMVQFFQELRTTARNGEPPKAALVSGSAHIIFDDKYPIRAKETGGGERLIIAFNRANDLKEPPDHSNVRTMKKFFPGTILSFRFYLDEAFLSKRGSDAGPHYRSQQLPIASG